MFVANSKLQSALKSSQISVDLLESISATELAQSVPFLRIQRIDPRKRIPLEGEPILNLYFQKPPEFGSSLSTRERYGERPPVSIKSFSIETKLMNGLDVQQEVSFQITIHRPSALTDPEENKWMSLITPMNTHLIEYGWVGTSKNGIINGEGIKDNDVFVDSVKSLVFTTAFYNFKVNNNGTIDITAKGYENGGYMLNRMYLGDRIKFHEDVNADNSAQARKRKPLEKINNKELRETLQKIIRDLRSDKQTSFGISGRRYAKLIDVLNALVAKSIVEVSNLWGFDQINLQIGDLNGRVPKLSRKFKNKKITNIGDFPVDLEKMIKFINTQTRKGSSITMKNFLYNLIQDTVNNSTSYGRGKPIKFNGRVLSEEIPMVRIKVIGTLSKRNKKMCLI